MIPRFYSSYVTFVVCLLIAGCGSSRKPVRYDNEISGYRGEAHRMPYLAAQRFLEHYDRWVDQRAVVRFDRDRYDAIFLPASVVKSRSQVAAVERYINDGGHLILMLANGDKEFSDFRDSGSGFDWFGTDQEHLESLLNKFHLSLVSEDVEGSSSDEMRTEEKLSYQVPYSEVVSVDLGMEPLNVSVGSMFSVTPDSPVDEETEVFDSFFNVGETHKVFSKSYFTGGQLTVISDARMFRNPHLGAQDHSTFLLSVLEDDYRILFTSGRHHSFYELVWKYFPLALLGIGFLVITWLLGRHQRFGPSLQLVIEQPLNYLKSIDASGHFLWKHRREDYLLSAITKKANKVSGMLALDSEQRALRIEMISDETGLSREELETALSKSKHSAPLSFIKTVQTLQKVIQQYE